MRRIPTFRPRLALAAPALFVPAAPLGIAGPRPSSYRGFEMNSNPNSPRPARFRRGHRLRLATVAVVGAALALPASASAEQFLQLSGSQYAGDGVAGYGKAIKVQSASFDIKRAPATSAPTFDVLTITKPVDRSSPALMLAAASGRLIKSARLTVRRSAAENYLTEVEYCFANVVVTSDQVNTRAGTPVPVETVALSYQEVTQSYTPTDQYGSQESAIVTGWSLPSARAIWLFPTTCGT